MQNVWITSYQVIPYSMHKHSVHQLQFSYDVFKTNPTNKLLAISGV